LEGFSRWRMSDTTRSSQTGSPWEKTALLTKREPLGRSTEADVCVVGAGIAGLTTAYLLSQAGRSVVVLDDGPAGGGMTRATTAHLTHALDDRYVHLESVRGEDVSRLAAESHTAAIDRIESIVLKESIECEFTRLDGYLFLSPNDRESLLDRELEAAHKAGLKLVEKLPSGGLPFDAAPSLRFPQQGQFHPLKYLNGLIAGLERGGGRLYTGTHVDRVEGGHPARVVAGSQHVTSNSVVVATLTPFIDRVKLHTKQFPYMTYVIAAPVPKGSVPKGLFWDTEDPYHYVRLTPLSDDADLLIVGGEDHKSGQAEDHDARFARLETWSRDRFPQMKERMFNWAGEVMETLDGLALIGPNPMDEDNVFVVTGDSGMGMTHGTIAGMLLTDQIEGRVNPWAHVYDPSRKPVRAAGRFIKEAANMAAQYADWIKRGDVSSEDDIALGHGAILRDGLKKLAVYRDSSGTVHRFSAVCTHLGCIVAWNAAAATWDCPCHGSRFDALGKVVNGPANQDLPRVD
jgi:glycine/D-amino acid oxidase-like deaminating enzyme/nitrite reductase/ring-hydroxylating ferredoxin subunit